MSFLLYATLAILLALIGGAIWIWTDEDGFGYLTIMLEFLLGLIFIATG